MIFNYYLIRENSDSEVKRKIIKLSTRGTQTENAQENQVTVEDLTSESPSEAYWERLAEKRREALDVSLKENELLHEKVKSLEEELNTSRQMVEEARSLVEVLKEIIQDSEPAEDLSDKEADK